MNPLAACGRLPPGEVCNDIVQADPLPSVLMVLGAIAIVTVVIWLGRRARPPLAEGRGLATVSLTVAALVATTTAMWASTHEFQGGCTLLHGEVGCARTARLVFLGYALGAAAVLWGLAIAVRGPRSRVPPKAAVNGSQ